MSVDPADEPQCHRSDDDVLGRLATIDHRLHQISTQLTTLSAVLSQLDEIRTNLETLTGSLESAGSAPQRVGGHRIAASPYAGGGQPTTPPANEK